ncbi:DUF6907 domain-containing protein [Nocardia farcinica]|nr:hypothetical protein [Nocardia farcinica]
MNGITPTPEPVNELSVAQAQNAITAARPCPSWCDTPGGHADEAPADRSCWSEDRGLALNIMPWHRGLPIVIETGAMRPVGETESVVTLLFKNGPEELSGRLTAWEARRLAADLLHFANLTKEK